MSSSFGTDGGGSGGSFNPSGLPLVDDGGQVRLRASQLATAVDGIGLTAESVRSAWLGLHGAYAAPEAGELVVVMDRPRDRAQDFGAQAERARSALVEYAGRLEELARRRESIAAAMTAQNTAWAQFHVDFPPVDPAADGPQGLGSTRIPDDRERAANALYDADKKVMGDAAQFAHDVVAADVVCANAISAIDCGTQWHVNGEDSGPDGAGGTPDMYLAAARRGESPWGAPQSWTDDSSVLASRRLDDQFLTSGSQMFWAFAHTVYGSDGEKAAAREGLWEGSKQALMDFSRMADLPSAVVDWDGYKAAWGRQAGPLVSWGNWEHDPHGAMGDVGFSLVLMLSSKGVGKAGELGLQLGRAGLRNVWRETALVNAGRGLKSLSEKIRNTPLRVPTLGSQEALAGIPKGALGGGGMTLDEMLTKWRTGMMEMRAKAGAGGKANKPLKPLPTLPPNAVIKRVSKSGANEATYFTNDQGIVTRVTATLRQHTEKAKRSWRENALTRLVGKHGVDGDHGGHLIAHRFMQELGIENFFPQNGNFNTSAWRMMEDEWAAWIDHGMEVRPRIEKLPRGAVRPDSLRVSYQVLDPQTGRVVDTFRPRFSNAPGEIFERKRGPEMDQMIAETRDAS